MHSCGLSVNYGPASKYYDLFASMDDVGFYKELALERGKKALELGAGTGRVAIPLARAGVTVLSIDKSRRMLHVLRRKLEKESSVVSKRVIPKFGDMRRFRVKEKLPFVYMASATFEHCLTEEDQRNCLAGAFDALEKNGVLAFDISQPRKKQESSWRIDRREQSGEEEVVRSLFSGRREQTGIVCVNLFFDVYRNEVLKERYYEYGEARISAKKDVEAILKSVGFQVSNVYGDFDRSDFDQESERAIFVAVKP